MFGYSGGANIYIIFFPLGILFAMFKDKKINSSVLLSINLVLCIICNIIHNNSTVIAISIKSLCFSIITLYLVMVSQNSNTVWLEFLGNISYDIYLLEGVFLNKYNFLKHLLGSTIIYKFSYLVFIMLISFMFNKLFYFISSKIKKEKLTT